MTIDADFQAILLHECNEVGDVLPSHSTGSAETPPGDTLDVMEANDGESRCE
jgi:hypothetical protein